tara:strand:+ start:598 stop:1203 length:606 start_codon:yes stop_codon:yes gene_type:complete
VNKKYQIIYADPPWSYNARLTKKTKFGGGAMGHYDTMTIDEIKELPIQNLASDNAVLFMWATFPKLQEGLDVIAAWGFIYKTLGFSWHKENKNGSLFHGVGSYAKSNCEVCLMGIRGKVGIKTDVRYPDKLVVQSHCVSSAVNAKRERHSKKPIEIRDRIVSLFGDVSKLELFAREKTAGWDSWGNEVNGVPLQMYNGGAE